MPTQAAFLLGPLSTLDDARAAQAAEALIANYTDYDRTMREVAYALRDGTGPATLVILQRLAAHRFASVREDALDSLSRRGAA